MATISKIWFNKISFYSFIKKQSGMSEICEWDQINKKIHYRASKRSGAKMSNLLIESLTEQFWYFKIKRVKQVKQTLTENLIGISFMFFQESEWKILTSHCLSAKYHLTSCMPTKWLRAFLNLINFHSFIGKRYLETAHAYKLY